MNVTKWMRFTPGKPAEEIFPCRCGETHSGPYAAYDYGHHNCFHGPLMLLDDHGHEGLKNQLICVDCGEMFEMVHEGKK